MTGKAFFLVLTVGLILAGFPGCAEDPPPSLYDQNYTSGPQPIVTSISPTEALAGVTMLTITGSNFSPVPGNNIVLFDKTVVPVLQASATQLQLRAPNLPKDSIRVKVAVLRSDLYSESVLYRLSLAADETFGNFAPSEEPVSVECDAQGNVYVSMLASGQGIGVKRFTPAGSRTDYSPAFSTTVASWRGMKIGPAGAIFAVAARPIIFRIPPGGGSSAIWLSGSGLANLYDLDFDANGNIWAGGPTTNVFRIKQDKSVKAFPFVGTVRSVRVFNNYLYVGGKRDSLEKVWRFPLIAPDSLGAVEEYFNLSDMYGANSFGVFGLTFDSEGGMYIGTDAPAGIVLVKADKSYGELYPGVLSGQTLYLAWGDGFNLYQSRSGTAPSKTIVKINTLKNGAPYYGRFLP